MCQSVVCMSLVPICCLQCHRIHADKQGVLLLLLLSLWVRTYALRLWPTAFGCSFIHFHGLSSTNSAAFQLLIRQDSYAAKQGVQITFPGVRPKAPKKKDQNKSEPYWKCVIFIFPQKIPKVTFKKWFRLS